MALNPNCAPKNKVDIVSSLPDEILIHILSLIPTKYAVRTSILSSRWKFLWTFVPNLNFTFSRDHDDMASFINFVDRVLLLHNLPNIEQFSLTVVNKVDNSRLNSWIGVAIERNVKQLSIITLHSTYQLPRSLFTCKSLVNLKLRFNFQLDVPYQIHFPCLRTLDVSTYSGGNGFPRRLFNSCPVLEILFLQVVGDFEERTFNISIPTLRQLTLHMLIYPYRELDSVFVIDAPVLESLFLLDTCVTHYVLKNTSPIVEGRLLRFTHNRQDLLGNHTYPMIKVFRPRIRNLEKEFGLLKTFSHVKYLDLNSDVMAGLGIADVKDWPLFPNLLRLRVGVNDEPGFKSLSVLLIKAPMLKRLTVSNGNQLTWYKPQGSPRYLQMCLRKIILTVQGSQTDLSLIKYLLGNAGGLRKMTIFFDTEKAKEDEFYGKLTKFRRVSQACDITVNNHLWIRGSKSCNAGFKRKYDEPRVIVLE